MAFISGLARAGRAVRARAFMWRLFTPGPPLRDLRCTKPLGTGPHDVESLETCIPMCLRENILCHTWLVPVVLE